MGAGKSTVGPLLANQLGLQWIDLDQIVEEKTGQSIGELWRYSGEVLFRRLEAEALESLGGEACVVGCGGGVVTYERSKEVLANRGHCVYLRASPEELAARIWRGGRAETEKSFSHNFETKAVESRPLLLGVSSEEELKARLSELLSAREHLYEDLANFVVDTENRSPQEVAKSIAEWWEQKCR